MRSVGIAGGTEKGSYVATCAEVAADKKSGRVKVVRVVTAFECGAVLNPDHLKNQVEGAVVMGLGGALFEVSWRAVSDRRAAHTRVVALPTALDAGDAPLPALPSRSEGEPPGAPGS